MGPITLLHDSPLGRWHHTEWSPPPLAGIVERVWHFDGRTAHRHERAFPNGLPELIVQLGDRYREARDGGDRFDPCPRLCLSGIQTTATVIESPDRPGSILGIRLTPIGAWLLLDRPAHAVANTTVDLADLFPDRVAELEDRVLCTTDPHERVRQAAAWVALRVARTGAPDRGVLWAAAELERTHGRATVGSIRDRLGYSKTRLAATFREQVGLLPKTYARVLRFRHALTLINTTPASLSTIAAQSGYYDQPHLNADFRELAGMRPTDFQRATRYAGSVNLAE